MVAAVRSSRGNLSVARGFETSGLGISCVLSTQRENDGESGLMHYRARSYDPGLGRFVQKDPIRTLAFRTHFIFAGNDPTRAGDPTGLQADKTSTHDAAVTQRLTETLEEKARRFKRAGTPTGKFSELHVDDQNTLIKMAEGSPDGELRLTSVFPDFPSWKRQKEKSLEFETARKQAAGRWYGMTLKEAERIEGEEAVQKAREFGELLKKNRAEQEAAFAKFYAKEIVLPAALGSVSTAWLGGWTARLWNAVRF